MTKNGFLKFNMLGKELNSVNKFSSLKYFHAYKWKQAISILSKRTIFTMENILDNFLLHLSFFCPFFLQWKLPLCQLWCLVTLSKFEETQMEFLCLYLEKQNHFIPSTVFLKLFLFHLSFFGTDNNRKEFSQAWICFRKLRTNR